MKTLQKNRYMVVLLVLALALVGLEAALTRGQPIYTPDGYPYADRTAKEMCRDAVARRGDAPLQPRFVEVAFYGETDKGFKTTVYDVLGDNGAVAVKRRYGCGVYANGRVDVNRHD